MKSSVLAYLCLIFAQNIFAQNKRWELKESYPLRYHQIVDLSQQYFQNDKDQRDTSRIDKEIKRFNRWQWYWQGRITDIGDFPDLIEQNQIYKSLQFQTRSQNLNQVWTNISQTVADGGYNGMGRLTSVAFHPTDINTFYVGAPIGGIWKTTDGGSTWAALGDSLPYVSVGNIAIHPHHPDSIFITIGDHQGWWNYGLGIYLSTDGGITWNPTAQSTDFTNQDAFLKLVMDPLQPQRIWSAQSNGLYKSEDGGETWTLAHSGYHNDIVIKHNSHVVYTCRDDYWGSSEVFVSYDNGISWQQITDFNEPYASNIIAVTPANPEQIALIHRVNGIGQFHLSQDSLFNWQLLSEVPEDWVLYCSPNDAQKIYCGGINAYQSINGGEDWNQQSMWYDVAEYPTVHADQRFIAHHPITHEIFFCNDGGLYKYNETNDQWLDLSNGLVITQFYRIAVSQNDETFMTGGTQDNGGRKRIAPNQWAATNGGDAMEVAIDPQDDQTIYTTYTYGTLYRSDDQWNNHTYQEITPSQTSGGGWVTPYVLDPFEPSTIVAGYEDVFISHNRGNTWTQISNNLTGAPENKITAIAMAPSDPNIIYASFKNKVYTTLDGGNTWESHNAYLQGPNSGNITSIVVHPDQPSKIWVTINGYQSGNKVRYSSNYGTTFSNFTQNLPNTPVSCAIIDEESELRDLYIGTDLGVFVYNDTIGNWNYFGSGIPNTAISDLEIQYSSRKLRAGTFGRGIWETGLYSNALVGVNNLNTTGANWIEMSSLQKSERLVLNVHAQSTEKIQLNIYTASGQIAFQKELTFVMGNHQISIDGLTLNPAQYILSVQGKDYSQKGLKFMVTEGN